MNSFFRKLRWLTRKSDKEAELREELQFHLEQEAEQRQDDGLTEGEARWAARRELGNRRTGGGKHARRVGLDATGAVRARRRPTGCARFAAIPCSPGSQSRHWRSASAGLPRCSAPSTRC